MSYADSSSGVSVSLKDGLDIAGTATDDQFEGIENVSGSALADLLVGVDAGSVLRREAGDDILTGAAGQDQLYGGEGDDAMTGGKAFDALVGGAGTTLSITMDPAKP